MLCSWYHCDHVVIGVEITMSILHKNVEVRQKIAGYLRLLFSPSRVLNYHVMMAKVLWFGLGDCYCENVIILVGVMVWLQE